MTLVSAVLETPGDLHAAPPSFDELYRAHWKFIHGHCRRLLRCSTAAQDAAQEAFLRTLRTGRRFDSVRDARRYLARAATNVCLNLTRQRSRRSGVSFGVHMPCEQPSAEDRLGALQWHALLADRCGSRVMETAMMTLADGHCQEDVARLLGCSRRTVFNRLRRIETEAERLGWTP